MTLSVRGTFPGNVFELFGKHENSATYALGWVLDRCPHFAELLVGSIAGTAIDTDDAVITLQKTGDDQGYTDVEIRCGPSFHAILEAKQGWHLPGLQQLRRYRPRLSQHGGHDGAHRLVSVSAASAELARLRLPAEVDGVPLIHLSWGTLRGMARKARHRASSLEEKLWLQHFIHHLENYTAMQRTRDNMVYVVSVGSGPVRPGSAHTWIDVIESDGCYFHPVGNHWPAQPPNYVGFRYRGKLQSVHRIKSHEIVLNLADKNAQWCDTKEDHFVYTLGPAMQPPRDLRAGGPDDTIKRSARVWCAIDTLLSGEFDTLGQARDETRRRLDEADQRDV